MAADRPPPSAFAPPVPPWGAWRRRPPAAGIRVSVPTFPPEPVQPPGMANTPVREGRDTAPKGRVREKQNGQRSMGGLRLERDMFQWPGHGSKGSPSRTDRCPDWEFWGDSRRGAASWDRQPAWRGVQIASPLADQKSVSNRSAARPRPPFFARANRRTDGTHGRSCCRRPRRASPARACACWVLPMRTTSTPGGAGPRLFFSF